MKTPYYILSVASLLFAPAFYLLLIFDRTRGLPVATRLRFIGLNYLYMATPHLLVLLGIIVGLISRTAGLHALVVLTLCLTPFIGWIRFFVPPREGLAWLLYVPLWLVALILVAAFSI